MVRTRFSSKSLWGSLVALATEGLSLFRALSPTGIAVLWAASLLGIGSVGWSKGWLLQGARQCRDVLRSLDRLEWILTAGFSLILGALFVVAYLAPANTSDSLQYHMTRVVHWAQNQSIRHYATSFNPQIYNPIWAEEVILHFRQLWGNDRLANLVQWFSMAGSLIGVSFLARLLGANRKGQMAAAAFALSLPMGLLQATSTQNDYVVAFWLICLLSLTALSTVRPLTKLELLSTSLVLGLGLLTKGTFYPLSLIHI